MEERPLTDDQIETTLGQDEGESADADDVDVDTDDADVDADDADS